MGLYQDAYGNQAGSECTAQCCKAAVVASADHRTCSPRTTSSIGAANGTAEAAAYANGKWTSYRLPPAVDAMAEAIAVSQVASSIRFRCIGDHTALFQILLLRLCGCRPRANMSWDVSVVLILHRSNCANMRTFHGYRSS